MQQSVFFKTLPLNVFEYEHFETRDAIYSRIRERKKVWSDRVMG